MGPTDACLRDKAIIRVACPQHCGCTQPLTGAYLMDGCSFNVCVEAWKWEAARARLGTADPQPAVLLQASPAWHQYWHGFEITMTTGSFERNRLRLGAKQANQIASAFRSSGCGALALFANLEPSFSEFLCSETLKVRRHLRAFCPEACRCGESAKENSRFCPTR